MQVDLWAEVEEALFAYIGEFANRLRTAGPVPAKNLRWRLEGASRVVLNIQEELVATEEVFASAFHLSSYARLLKSLIAIPSVTKLQTGRGPMGFPMHVNLDDFVIRTAGTGLRFLPNAELMIDDRAIRDRLGALRELAESDTIDIELRIVLQGPYLARDQQIQLDGSCIMRRLLDEELLFVAQRGLILPRPRYDALNRQPSLVVDIRESERVAIVRRLRSPNVGAEQSIPQFNLTEIVAADASRLGDALAIEQGVRLDITGWYAAPAIPLSGPISWQSLKPLTPDPSYSVLQYPVSEESASIWRTLMRAETAPEGSAIRLGSRRVGLAVARNDDADRLVDAMIALEALLDIDDDERNKAAVTGLRASMLCEQPPPDLGGRVKSSVENAYKLRNIIVHGGPASPEQTQEAARRSLRVARAVAHEQLKRGSGSEPYRRDWAALVSKFAERKKR